MSLVHDYHEAHKARLVRLGGGPCRKPPDTIINSEIESLKSENAWLRSELEKSWKASIKASTASQLEAARTASIDPPPTRSEPRPLPERQLSIDSIIKTVAKFYNVRAIDIASSRRTMDIMKPRHVALFLCRNLTGRSLPAIGRLVGDRDHTTVLSAWRKIEKQRDVDKGLREELSQIERLLAVAS